MNARALHLGLAQNAKGPQRPPLPPREAKQGFRGVKNRANLVRACISRVLDRLAMGEINQLAFVQLDSRQPAQRQARMDEGLVNLARSTEACYLL